LNISDSNNMFIDGGEGIAAIRHCNNRDYWVLCKGKNDTLYRLLVSTNRQVLYRGYYLCKETTAQTGIVFSPNGKFISIGRGLYSFNRNTGKIKILHFDSALLSRIDADGVNSAAFSNNNKVLYRSYIDLNANKRYVFQYDLENSNSTLGRKNINELEYDIRTLQNAPDGKILLSASSMPYVSEIRNPNTVNIQNHNNCQFNEVSIMLSENGIGGTCGLDLPNFPNTSLVEKEALGFIAIQKNCNEVEFISNQTCGHTIFGSLEPATQAIESNLAILTPYQELIQ
jgi:hypothetical protein